MSCCKGYKIENEGNKDEGKNNIIYVIIFSILFILVSPFIIVFLLVKFIGVLRNSNVDSLIKDIVKYGKMISDDKKNLNEEY